MASKLDGGKAEVTAAQPQFQLEALVRESPPAWVPQVPQVPQVPEPPPTTTTTSMAARAMPHLAAVSSKGQVNGSPCGDDDCIWDRVAACESGGNWADNTGNGYYGGLQMDAGFWRTYGDGVADRPDLATRRQQIDAAVRARDSGRGYGPWPRCGRRA